MKILRKFALALSLFVPVVGAAQATQQEPDAPTQSINQAFSNLNAFSDVTFSIVGTERLGDRTIPFETTIVWRRVGVGLNRTQKVSLVKRVDGQLVHEIRANGKVLFSYDFKTRSYSATSYHDIKDTRNADQRDEEYTRRLLATLGRSVSSTGPDSYAARLVQESMGDPVGQMALLSGAVPLYYRSWMPGRAAYEVPLATPYPDPVVPEAIRPRYIADAENSYYLYASPRRSLVFNVNPKEMGFDDDELRSIFFGESSVVGGRNRLVQWKMTIDYPVVAPAQAATYEEQFAPYTDMRGWRVVTSAAAPRG